MLNYFMQYLLFLAEAITIVAAITAAVVLIAGLVREARKASSNQIEVENLNRRLGDMKQALLDEVQGERDRKQRRKDKKRETKARKRAAKAGQQTYRPRLFVLDFDGDVRATAVANLREEVSTVLQVAGDEDEVLLRLESAGGMVHGYGLAASQLTRLKDRGVRLTVAVDKVAASGGYMMACVAERIIAAPFAIVGSIGVVGQLPNFSRLLKKNNVDFELHTAGQHKRTLTLFGENSEDAREKFRDELEQTHQLFKAFVHEHRPRLELDQVATGEHWYGSQALELQLIDTVQTSDDYILQANEARDIYRVHRRAPKSLASRLLRQTTKALARARYTDNPPIRVR